MSDPKPIARPVKDRVLLDIELPVFAENPSLRFCRIFIVSWKMKVDRTYNDMDHYLYLWYERCEITLVVDLDMHTQS